MPEVAPVNGSARQPNSGFQKRIDKLTRQRRELEAANIRLQADLERAVVLIEKYKVALRAAKRVNNA